MAKRSIIEFILESDTKQYEKGLRRGQAQTRKFSRNASKSIDKLRTSFLGLTAAVTGLAAGYVSLSAASSTFSKSIDVFGRFEQIRTTLRNATDSAEEYQAVRKTIADAAKESPLSFEDLQRTATVFTSTEVDFNKESLVALSGLAAGSTDQEGALAAISDTLIRTGSGLLDAALLDRSTERGVNLVGLLGYENRDAAIAGGAEEFHRRLQEFLNDPEQYKSALQYTANLTSHFSVLGDAIDVARYEFVEAFAPQLKRLLKEATELISENEDVWVSLGDNISNILSNIDLTKLHSSLQAIPKTLEKIGAGFNIAFDLAKIGLITVGLLKINTAIVATFAGLKLIAPILAGGILPAMKAIAAAALLITKRIILSIAPVVLIGTAIGAVILIIRNLSEIVAALADTFQLVGNVISASFNYVIDGIRFAFNRLIDFLLAGYQRVLSLYEQIPGVGNIAGGLNERITAFRSNLDLSAPTFDSTEIVNAVDSLTNTASNAWGNIRGDFTRSMETIGLNDMVTNIGTLVGASQGDGIKVKTEDITQNTVDDVDKALNSIDLPSIGYVPVAPPSLSIEDFRKIGKGDRGGPNDFFFHPDGTNPPVLDNTMVDEEYGKKYGLTDYVGTVKTLSDIVLEGERFAKELTKFDDEVIKEIDKIFERVSNRFTSIIKRDFNNALDDGDFSDFGNNVVFALQKTLNKAFTDDLFKLLSPIINSFFQNIIGTIFQRDNPYSILENGKFRSVFNDNKVGQPGDGLFSGFFRSIFGGIFHDGGIVPGAPGQERLILARAGEAVFTPEQQRQMGQNTYVQNIYGNIDQQVLRTISENKEVFTNLINETNQRTGYAS